ncbi:cell wall synthesis protein CwsA [Mycolicibacterium sp. P1-18]|uniref:cell wall synthesis protein CwsA n=1 Tax=Mycolicibacterium sp. P1-18 TaxID=2024615 RepID=UPI0011F30852|nr:cell wall synthesis protein CwsA [Mycolicibacterium sp. P1-18]KAA0099779.1 cell wall synthesis protein CwsA [Mycolicibacterium sp. P1-18]
MSSTTSAARLTPTARIARGLKYTTVGPVDVTRGAVGVALNSTRSSVAWAADRYRRDRLKSQLTKDFAAAQEAIASEFASAQDAVTRLPDTFKSTRRSRRRPKPIVVVGVGVAVLAVGAVSFSIIRRSTQPDPSPLPPSIDATPRP